MIQIFGTTKSFDTKKALMFFKERRIPFQFIDLKEKEMSRGEFDSVFNIIKKKNSTLELAITSMADKTNKDYSSLSYLQDEDKAQKLFECQNLLKLPICRNGKTDATTGLQIEIWKTWS